VNEPRQPLDPCFGEREAKPRKPFGYSGPDDCEESHQERCPIRERDRHEQILKQAGKRWALETDMNVDRPVEFLGFRPERIELAAVEKLIPAMP
jgi:hypothetical protein